MERITLNVEGMSCEHCVKAVRNALSDLDGVADVSVSLEGKTVTLEHDPSKTSVEKLRYAITEEGYDVV